MTRAAHRKKKQIDHERLFLEAYFPVGNKSGLRLPIAGRERLPRLKIECGGPWQTYQFDRQGVDPDTSRFPPLTGVAS
jgi:hypothetical protein